MLRYFSCDRTNESLFNCQNKRNELLRQESKAIDDTNYCNKRLILVSNEMLDKKNSFLRLFSFKFRFGLAIFVLIYIFTYSAGVRPGLG